MSGKVILVTGFLGAGKTTFINKILPEIMKDNTVAIIENDFGDISVDSKLLKEHGVEIREISSGCICCSLKGDLLNSIKILCEEVNPDYIIMEPSGVARTSDILGLLELVKNENIIDSYNSINIVDCDSFLLFIDDFGAFYKDQIANGEIQFLSRVDEVDLEDRYEILNRIDKLNNNSLAFDGDFLDISNEEIYKIIKNTKEVKNNIISCDFSVDNIFNTITVKPVAKSLSDIKEQIEYTIKESPEILRLKGFYNEDNKVYHIEYSYGSLKIEECNIETDSQLVIIGTGVDENMVGRLII